RQCRVEIPAAVWPTSRALPPTRVPLRWAVLTRPRPVLGRAPPVIPPANLPPAVALLGPTADDRHRIPRFANRGRRLRPTARPTARMEIRIEERASPL